MKTKTEKLAEIWEKNFDKKAAKVRAERVLGQIKKYNPKAKSVLELGVGLGFVLSHFNKYEKYGLDLNKEYISIAKRITPNAKYFVSSMHNFKMKEKFDVIFSVHECINEVKPFENWEGTFESAYKRLNEGGLFVFDMRTVKDYKFKRNQVVKLEKTPTGYVYDNAIIKGNRLIWDVTIFKKVKGDLYQREYDSYEEITFSLEKVKNGLSKRFRVLKMIPINDGKIMMFVCRRAR